MKIAIIGGGITGLTTSLALHRLGIKNTVYEKADELNAVGAGIWLQPNAIKVLNWLGVSEAIKAEGMELDRMEITNSDMLAFKPMKNEVVEDKQGNRTIAIHRAKLQQILLENVQKFAAVVLDKPYETHRSQQKKEVITFQNGEEIIADLIIGADGIHSKVRQKLFPDANLRDSKQMCWRGVATLEVTESMDSIGREMWGSQRRFGLSAISNREVYWFAVMNTSQHNTLDLSNLSDLMQQFSDFHPLVTKILEHTNPQAIHKGPLLDLERLDSWHKGRTILLGDAAHATTPNMGQGACQGIEDAYYFSNILKDHLQNPQGAFEIFQERRTKKVNQIVNNSWRFGKMAHHKVGQWVMKSIFKMTPESVMSKAMNALYEVEGL